MLSFLDLPTIKCEEPILDAHITPRAREVLMLLASQTSAAEPALWICQKTIAERLRCSVATVARSIRKLVEAKLIAETGKLHEGRYKFYHVRWAVDENLKRVEKKIKKPVRLRHCERQRSSPGPAPSLGGGEESFVQDLDRHATTLDDETPRGPSAVTPPPAPVQPSTISPTAFTNDSRIAYHAEIARQKWLENRRRYQAELLSMR